MKSCLSILTILLFCGIAFANDKTIEVDEGRFSIALPPGWKDSEQKQTGTNSIAGWESSDRKTSLYIHEMELVNQAADIFDALDQTVENFDTDKNWIVKSIGKTKDSKVGGLPAAYCRVELDLVAGEREVPFVFYFTMVGGGKFFFLLQASTMKPVREVRELELFRMIRSFKVLKEK